MASIPFRAVQDAGRVRTTAVSTRGALPPGDARWILAARACLVADKPAQMDPDARARLTAWGVRRGVAPIHAAAIIAIGEMAASRGGLTPDDAARIAALPEPAGPSSGDAMGWILALVIAGLAVVAAALVVLRFF